MIQRLEKPAIRRVSTSLAASVAFAAALSAVPAAGQEAWAHVEGQARVVLPAPGPGSGFGMAELSCAEQVWTLELQPNGPAEIASLTGEAEIVVGSTPFATTASDRGGKLVIDIPYPAIEPMRAYNRMAVVLPGLDRELGFPLIGSRRAITAAEQLCTPRQLPSADAVPLTPYSSYANLARKLRAGDIEDAVLSTSAQPALRAGMLELGDSRRLLFVELCGSSWYYGASGCGVIGYKPVEGADVETVAGWASVFESEGAHLYVDRENANEGWPVLRALPLREGAEVRWAWNGSAYAPAGATADADGRSGIVEGLRR